ncbi:MAG: TIGR04283 family arsenosugar biosynthesis glycosyltransferase [Chthoniobacterales bacterium]|nr:TIGR04283 family arsenosugar biosynthesis glycosyltransferase [Chthoniobacterales bacterium]
MSESPAAPVRISVVVPSWNDRAHLQELVPALVRLKELHEVIVVDASADPAIEDLVRGAGGIYLGAPEPNRGAQMNLGASRASGDVMVFQHADAILRAEHLTAIARALRDPAVIGGAFYRKFDRRHPHLHGLEKVARFFTRRGGTLFGDQSIFVRREIFNSLGGFAPVPLMEDIEFSRRLRRAGRIAVLDPPIESSSRRHLDRGAWRTSIQNGLFILLYWCGCSPHRLHRWYYTQGRSMPNECAEAARAAPPAKELSRR